MPDENQTLREWHRLFGLLLTFLVHPGEAYFSGLVHLKVAGM